MNTSRWAIALSLTLMSCNETRAPLPLRSITLHGIHGLWGGEDIFLTSDGSLWVRRLTPRSGSGFDERRYAGRLPIGDVRELEALLGKHDFPSLRIAARTGLPDEPLVGIDLRLGDGRVVSLTAFEGDVHEGFTPVYHWLRSRAKRIDGSKPTYEGSSVESWKPEGF
jgi:hypothetical protein